MNLLIKSLIFGGCVAFSGYGTYKVADIYGLTSHNKRVIVPNTNQINNKSDTKVERAAQESNKENSSDLSENAKNKNISIPEEKSEVKAIQSESSDPLKTEPTSEGVEPDSIAA